MSPASFAERVRHREHSLKTWPGPFAALRDGSKTFELRYNGDRGFAVNDLLDLREWNPATRSYSGEREVRRVTYVCDISSWVPNAPIGWVVLGLGAADVLHCEVCAHAVPHPDRPCKPGCVHEKRRDR